MFSKYRVRKNPLLFENYDNTDVLFDVDSKKDFDHFHKNLIYKL